MPNNTPPIDHWSQSSMNALLRNPLSFKKQYILKQFDNIDTPSSIVGQACHKALEEFYKNGKTDDECIKVGLDYIESKKDFGIDYGKTGSREKIISTYSNAIKWYLDEVKPPYKILGVEESFTIRVHTIENTPRELPLPIKVKYDMLVENDLGELEIIDHKFSKSFTDPDEDNFNHFLQGMFYYHAIKEKYGRAPKRITFNECKTSLNSRDNKGMPQLQPYSIEFEGAYADFATFYALFNKCTEFISRPDPIFLPNPNDVFDGKLSFELFRSGVVSVDAPVAVKIKTEQVRYAEKNYTPSVYDQVGNDHFTSEEKIRAKLGEFGLGVEMQKTIVGPSVIRYTMKPNRGVRMRDFSKMTNDLALALEAKKVRIEAPIRGTSLVGVEVANPNRKIIELGENHFKMGTTMLPIGVDVLGETHYADITEMPHLLIAGQTGAGKSVMLNVILKSLTKQMSPDNLKLLLIDPKQVELSMFDDVPHLFERTVTLPDGSDIKTGGIVTDVEDSINALEDMVNLMEQRYTVLRAAKVRNVQEYRKKNPKSRMPTIVIVVDEFADLMMAGGKKAKKAQFAEITERDFAGKPIAKYKKEVSPERPSVEQLIMRIGQKARAVGIHLIIATQRPSADVVTGLIKANIPTKIAFTVTNEINSKIIIDQAGAEELTGKGDMLFTKDGGELVRLQGLYE